jgi:hypothetical protein
MVDNKIDAENTTFNVKNNRSGFQGNVTLKKKMEKRFINDDDFIEEMTTYEVSFYVMGTMVMKINYEPSYDSELSYTYQNKKEIATFTHYKHIADINSFFLTIKFV